MGILIGKEQSNKVKNSTEKSAVRGTHQTNPSYKPNSVYEMENTESSKSIYSEGYKIRRNNNSKQINNTGTLLQRLNSLNNKNLNALTEKQKIEFIQSVSGRDISELSKMKASDLDLIFNSVRRALINCNSNDMNKVAKTANGFYIAIKYGQWNNIEQFIASQANSKESLGARLKRTGQTVDEYMESQFGKNRTLIGRGIDFIKAKRARMSVKEFKARQSMQDLSKLIANSNKEDKFKLIEAIKHLEQADNIDKNNRVNALRMIFASLSPEEKIEFAHKFIEVNTILKVAGNDANKATLQGIEHNAAKHMSEKDAIAHNRNIDYNVTDVESRISEIEIMLNSPNISKEKKLSLQKQLEQLKNTLNNVYTPLMAGNITGSEANRNIVTAGVLELIIANNVSHTNNMDVLKSVAEYTITHTEEMQHTEEAFRELMDSITNGKYSMVENKVREEYEETLASENNQYRIDNSDKYEYRNSNEDENIDFEKEYVKYYSENIKAEQFIDNKTKMYSNDDVSESSAVCAEKKLNQEKLNYETQTSYNASNKPKANDDNDIKLKSSYKKIRAGLKNDKKGSSEWNNAVNEYKSGSTGLQLLILTSGLNTTAFNELVMNSKPDTLEMFIASGNKGPDSYATGILNDRLDKLKEKDKENKTT